METLAVPCAAAPTPDFATGSRASKCSAAAAARSSTCGRSRARSEIRAMFSTLYTTGEGSLPELRDYYGFCYDDVPSNPLVQLYERWLDALERVREPGRLLDVGCGTGLFLAVARRRGWQPFGIDDCAEATRTRASTSASTSGTATSRTSRRRAGASRPSPAGTSSSTRALRSSCSGDSRAVSRRAAWWGSRLRTSAASSTSVAGALYRLSRRSHPGAAREVLHRAALPLLHAGNARAGARPRRARRGGAAGASSRICAGSRSRPRRGWCCRRSSEWRA